MKTILVLLIESFSQALAASIIIFKQTRNITKQKKIIFFVSMWIYCIIGQLFIPNQLRFILYILILSILILLVLKIKDKKIVLYSFNSVMVLSLSEIIVTICMVLIGINSKQIVSDTKYNLIANMLISFLGIVIINIPLFKKLLCKFINLFEKNKKLIKYLYIFIIVLYVVTLKNGLELLLKSNYYLNILFILIIVMIVTVVVKNESKYDMLKEENRIMLEYVSKYEKIITNQGKSNHEFKNQLMVIRGYAQMKSDKIFEYIDSIMNDVKKVQSRYIISQLNKFPDGGIKGLLYYKLLIMDEEKIKYEISCGTGVKRKLNSLSIEDNKNITKILGVLLDNAIDACKKCKNKNIIITVNCAKNLVKFNILNTYKGKIDISKIGTGFSTKGKGHGYGLKLIKDIIYENNNFTTKYSVDKDYYVVNFDINTKY